MAVPTLKGIRVYSHTPLILPSTARMRKPHVWVWGDILEGPHQMGGWSAAGGGWGVGGGGVG